MKYVKIENGVVVQVQPYEKDGFIECSDDAVVSGFTYDGVNFTAPSIPAPDLKAVLEKYRYKKEIEGIEIANINVQTDRESRANLMAARIMAKEDSEYTVKWKSPDGFVELNATEIITLADAARQHVENCYAVEAAVIPSIDDGTHTTAEDVEAAFDSAFTAL